MSTKTLIIIPSYNDGDNSLLIITEKEELIQGFTELSKISYLRMTLDEPILLVEESEKNLHKKLAEAMSNPDSYLAKKYNKYKATFEENITKVWLAQSDRNPQHLAEKLSGVETMQSYLTQNIVYKVYDSDTPEAKKFYDLLSKVDKNDIKVNDFSEDRRVVEIASNTINKIIFLNF